MGARAIKKPKRLLLTEEELKAQVRRANPLNDALFKYLFASEGNKENLMRLLNDVLGPERRVVDVEYLDRGNDPRRNEGRASFLDVLACSEDGRIFHVEVQLLNEGYFFERVTYYSACSLADQLSRGEGYDSLRPVVFVSLLWFDLFPNRPEDWRSVHRIMDEEDHRCYSDLLEFHFFELSKLKRLFEMGCLEELEETGLERLLRYLGRIGGESEMDRLVEQDPGIERLRRGEQSFFRVPGNLASYRMRERMETDHWNAFKYVAAEARSKGRAEGRVEGEAKGRAEGRAEGRADGRADAARNLLRMGLEVSQISEATGLSPDEIEALRGRLN